MLAWSRYSALLFAVGLAIGEAVINWGHWQYAPLWIVDYVIVVWLLAGFFATRLSRNLHVLQSGWAFTSGVFYMAFFIAKDPEIANVVKPDATLLTLIGILLTLSVAGFLCALLAGRQPTEHPLEAM